MQPGLTLIGPMSSYTRQRFPLYREQCRAPLDMIRYSVFYVGFSQVFATQKAAFEIRRLGTFCKINFYQNVGIHDDDLGWQWEVLTDAGGTNKLTGIACQFQIVLLIHYNCPELP